MFEGSYTLFQPVFLFARLFLIYILIKRFSKNEIRSSIQSPFQLFSRLFPTLTCSRTFEEFFKEFFSDSEHLFKYRIDFNGILLQLLPRQKLPTTISMINFISSNFVIFMEAINMLHNGQK